MTRRADIKINGVLYKAQHDVRTAPRGFTIQGFTSRDEFYNVYVAHERGIERAADLAVDNGYTTGNVTTKSGIEIEVTLHPTPVGWPLFE